MRCPLGEASIQPSEWDSLLIQPRLTGANELTPNGFRLVSLSMDTLSDLIPRISEDGLRKYFDAMGYRLIAGTAFDEPWTVVGPDGRVWNNKCYTLASLWGAWLEQASDILIEETKLDLFMAEFVAGDEDRRAELMLELEPYIADRSPNALETLFEPVVLLTPDRLPERWPEKLAKNLGGRLRARAFEHTVFEYVAEIDPGALADWEVSEGWRWARRGDELTRVK